ncbi:MAG: hypothetical protein R3E86_08815 [Pseudomonadales bacterium]
MTSRIKRSTTIFLLLLGAVASYAVGWIAGVWLFVGLGAVLELSFWAKLLVK